MARLARWSSIGSLGLRVLGAVLARLGLARSEAVVLAAISGFFVYLGLLLWAFSIKSVARLWLALPAWAALLALLLHCVK